MWAMAVVSSRQNPVPLGNKAVTLALIPLFDMFNHSSGQVREHRSFYSFIIYICSPSENNKTQITSFFDDKERALECLSMRDFKKGEQVYIFYGERPNSELLLFSGFVFPNNACDALKLRVSLIEDDEASRQKKQSLLDALGLKPKKTTPNTEYELTYNQAMIGSTASSSSTLMKFARVNALNKDELNTSLESFKKGDAAPLSANHDDRSLQFVQKLLRQQLERYPSPISRDNNAVKQVIELVCTEKAMLESGVESIEAQLIKRKKQQQKRKNKKNKKKNTTTTDSNSSNATTTSSS